MHASLCTPPVILHGTCLRLLYQAGGSAPMVALLKGDMQEQAALVEILFSGSQVHRGIVLKCT